MIDHASGGRKLQKWSLALETGSGTQAFAVEKWFSLQLLQAVDADGVYKFLVDMDGKRDSENVLLLWVFNLDWTISGTILEPRRVIKLLWRKGASDLVIQNHRKQAGVETLVLEPSTFENIQSTLLGSKTILPPSMTQFNGWNVGVLSRFDRSDLEL
jgi:HECT-like Ubiquitin-conjugating enzyme (E2)-binding